MALASRANRRIWGLVLNPTVFWDSPAFRHFPVYMPVMGQPSLAAPPQAGDVPQPGHRDCRVTPRVTTACWRFAAGLLGSHASCRQGERCHLASARRSHPHQRRGKAPGQGEHYCRVRNRVRGDPRGRELAGADTEGSVKLLGVEPVGGPTEPAREPEEGQRIRERNGKR
jgi:hypothetical protein